MRVSLASLLSVLGTLATVIVAIVVAMWVARRRRDQELRSHSAPILVVPASAAPHIAMTPLRPQARTPVRVVELTPPSGRDVVMSPSGPVSGGNDAITATTDRFELGSVPAEVVLGQSLRFHRPPDGTLQFLPGHLEVVGGPDAGHEVRFVRPQSGPSEVTFGRKEGPPYKHVQLLEPTVSRTHARVVSESNRWRLVNLSRTNPVVVNGAPLDGVNSSHLLNEGDLVEMGALVFRFRAN